MTRKSSRVSSRGQTKLEIRCSRDVKVAFKTLAAQLDENYEETLRMLLKLEKDHPLMKRMKGIIERL
jgi:hypothetical protein